MKKLIYIVGVALCLSLCYSCKKEEDAIFSKSASQRLQDNVDELQTLLTSQEHGWKLYYFPGGANTKYGGFALTAKFDKNGRCSFQSILSENIDQAITSEYSVGKDVGTSLNFITYNELFHYFSDPDLQEGDGKGKGLEGDYEFKLQSLNNEGINLIGKKYHTLLRMEPLTKSATEFLQDVRKQQESYTNISGLDGIECTLDGQQINADLINNQYISLSSGDKNVKFSFMFSDNGVRLYKPFTFNGKTFNTIVWDSSTTSFTSPNKDLVIKLIPNPLGLKAEEYIGEYTLMYNKSDKGLPKVRTVSLHKVGNTLFELQGLPFPIYLHYDIKRGILKLNSQKIQSNPDVMLAMWDTKIGALTWGSGPGLESKWNGSKEDFVLNFESNGVKWDYKGEQPQANGFIIWTIGQGEAKSFGLSRFPMMKLIKNKQ